MTYRDYMRVCRLEYVTSVVKKHGGCVSAAAREAGYSRSTFYKLMQKLGVARQHKPSLGNDAWRELR